MVNVWEDLRELSAFNSQIRANVSSIDEQFNPINFQVNEDFMDAFRYSPEICFLNDTTFFVIWYGNGRSSPGLFSSLWKNLFCFRNSANFGYFNK